MTDAELEIDLVKRLEAYRTVAGKSLDLNRLFDPERQSAQRSLCETLEMLVQAHVDVACDGLEIYSLVEPTAELVELRGHMWCLGDPGGSWKEPFFARISISSASREIHGYSFGMGSAAHGLGKFPFESRRPVPEPSTKGDCLFYFEKSSR